MNITPTHSTMTDAGPSEAGPSSPRRPSAPADVQHVRPVPIPDTALVCIEYPGIIADEPEAEDPNVYSPLDKALASFHPSSLPSLTSSPHAALQFLSKIQNQGLRTVECRLGVDPQPLHHPSTTADGGERPKDHDHAELFRSPLIGEAVDTGNVVVRITKRTWRKRKRGVAAAAASGQDRAETEPPPLPQQASLLQQPEQAQDLEAMQIDPALIDESLHLAASVHPIVEDAAPSSSTAQAKEEERQKREKELRKREEERYTGEVRHEYKVEVVGVAVRTVRFRAMADFAYKPDLGGTAIPPTSVRDPVDGGQNDAAAAPPSAATSSTTDAGQQDPILALHAALATMDLPKLKAFQMPAQDQAYEHVSPHTGQVRSDLHLLPPAYFSRPTVPFNYAFKQHARAELQMVPRPPHRRVPLDPARTLTRSLSNAQQIQRVVNKVRLFNISPQGYRLQHDGRPPPSRPTAEVLAIESRVNPDVLARFRAILETRPVWSRVAFGNQLSEAERYEIEGTNAKVYFALIGYAMVGGAWRDTIVRFGYDVRSDVGARFYQRLFMKGKRTAVVVDGGRVGAVGDGRKGKDGGDAGRAMRDGSNDSSPSPSDDEDREGDDTGLDPAGPDNPHSRDDDGDGDNGMQDNTTEPAAAHPRSYHLFTGTTLPRSFGNFQLCDIVDPVAIPFIRRETPFPLDDDSASFSQMEEAEGEGKRGREVQWLREECDEDTGWYTREAYELIRAVVAARFRSLADEKRVLEESEVETVVQRWRAKLLEESV